VAAYFLPTWRLRRELLRLRRRGGRVQLILAGQTDVKLSQLASQRLYHGFLRRGVEIYEYQPQVLHAKMCIVDDLVYVGSSNLDARSLHINYELVVRVSDSRLAGEARALFDQILNHSQRIEFSTWRESRTLWGKLQERWAYFVLARLDPLVARWQLKRLR
jgi:cardiolipin synthase